MSQRLVHPLVLVLFVSMLTNAFGWAFNGEVFTHELEHEHHHMLSLDPTAHLAVHQREGTPIDSHLDAATHLCLHAAGQYQPFFFHTLPPIPAAIGMSVLTAFVSPFIPESVPDSPLRPPRTPVAG